jgi:hypothetical protein
MSCLQKRFSVLSAFSTSYYMKYFMESCDDLFGISIYSNPFLQRSWRDMKIAFEPGQDEVKVRVFLHRFIHPPVGRGELCATEADFHQHPWDLTLVRVLKGQYYMEVKTPAGEFSTKIVPNAEYALAASDFHRVRPITDEVLTLVVVGEKGIQNPQYCQPRIEMMTPHEFKRFMGRFDAWM